MLKQVTYSGPDQTSQTVVYTYDSLGRKATANDSANGLTTYTYDPITGNVASIASPQGTINYAYDPATGHEVRMSVTHDGSTVTDETDYAYDPQGRLEDVYAVVLQGVRYATFNGLADGNPTFTGGSSPLTTSYAYDGAGNLLSEADPDDTQTSYSYDALDRLTAETVTNTASNKPVFTEAYDLYDSGLKKDVTDTRYNADGSMLSQIKYAWTYDDDQRLESETLTVLQGAAYAPVPYADFFRYDLSGNRLGEEATGANPSVSSYGYNPDDQILTESRHGSGNEFFVLGIPVTNYFNANYSTQYHYDSFGKLLSSTGAQSNAGSAMTEWLFAGDGAYDPNTTWTYHLARFRDDFHFTTMDSYMGRVSDPMSLQKYVYDASNPTNAYDPPGHFTLIETLVAVGIVALLIGLFLAAYPSVHALYMEYALHTALMQDFNNSAVVSQNPNWEVETVSLPSINIGDVLLP